MENHFILWADHSVDENLKEAHFILCENESSSPACLLEGGGEVDLIKMNIPNLTS